MGRGEEMWLLGRLVFLFGILSLVQSQAHSDQSDNALPPYQNEQIPFFPTQTEPDLSMRHQYAQKLDNFFKKLDNQIPALSPKETNWLEFELNSEDRVRQLRAMKSNEYDYMRAKNYTKSILYYTDFLIDKKI